MAEYKSDSETNLLNLPVEDWFEVAKKAVLSRNIQVMRDVDCLFTRFFCKKVVKQNFEDLDRYSKLMVNFMSWFEWGGEKKWDEAAVFIEKWKVLLELSQNIMETESPEKAYKELKRFGYGEKLVDLLYEKKLLKPSEIREELGINSMQQVSALLAKLESTAIITREVDGKNVWVSLGFQGIAVYKEYIEPQKTDVYPRILELFLMYENNELDEAKEGLQELMKKAPRNPLVICLLGIINLEKGDLYEAGKLFTRMVKIGIKKENAFQVFDALKKMHRFQPFVDNLYKMNTQGDRITEEIQPALELYGMAHEYEGKKDRANEYYRLRYRSRS